MPSENDHPNIIGRELFTGRRHTPVSYRRPLHRIASSSIILSPTKRRKQTHSEEATEPLSMKLGGQEVRSPDPSSSSALAIGQHHQTQREEEDTRPISFAREGRESASILLEVFSRLDAKTIKGPVAAVCKLWQDVANCEELWSMLSGSIRLVDQLLVSEKVAERRSKGRTYRCRKLGTGEVVLLRMVDLALTNAGKSDGVPTSFLREAALLKGLQHPHIIRHFGSEILDGQVAMCTEYVHENFSQWQRRLDSLPPVPRRMDIQVKFQQLLAGLHHVHRQGVMHRNLKPDNIFLTEEGYVKIGDFTSTRMLDVPFQAYTPEDPKERDRSGREMRRLWYRAPELILREDVYGPKVDLWSVGCLLAEAATGMSLFQSDSEVDHLWRIFRTFGTPTLEDWPEIAAGKCVSPKFPTWKGFSMAQVARGACKSQPDLDELLRQAQPDRVDILKNLLYVSKALGVEGTYSFQQLMWVSPAKRAGADQVLQEPFFSGQGAATCSGLSQDPVVLQWLQSDPAPAPSQCQAQAPTPVPQDDCEARLPLPLPLPAFNRAGAGAGAGDLGVRSLNFADAGAGNNNSSSNSNTSNSNSLKGEDNAVSGHVRSGAPLPSAPPLKVTRSGRRYGAWGPSLSLSLPSSSSSSSSSAAGTSEMGLAPRRSSGSEQEEGEEEAEEERQGEQEQDNAEEDEELSSSQNSNGSGCSTSGGGRSSSSSSCSSSCSKTRVGAPPMALRPHLMSPEMLWSVHCSMRSREKRTATVAPGASMQNLPKSFTALQRAELINFVVGLSTTLSLTDYTLHLAVQFLDRYLAVRAQQGEAVPSSSIRVIGATCLKVADVFVEQSKEYYKQDNAVEYADACFSSTTAEDILEFEKELLKLLNFDLHVPTTNWFIQCYLTYARFAQGSFVAKVAGLIGDLLLMDNDMLRYPPSLRAQCAVTLAAYVAETSNAQAKSTPTAAPAAAAATATNSRRYLNHWDAHVRMWACEGNRLVEAEMCMQAVIHNFAVERRQWKSHNFENIEAKYVAVARNIVYPERLFSSELVQHLISSSTSCSTDIKTSLRAASSSASSSSLVAAAPVAALC